MVKTLQQDRLKLNFFKIMPKEEVATIKVFGDAINPSIPSKTLLLSKKDTASWVVKKMLDKYGLKHEDPKKYCLIQIVIPPRYQMDNKAIKEIILLDKECPLNICLNHSGRCQGSIIFKVIKCPPEYIQLLKQETTSNRSKILSIQDRTIHDQLCMFFEINQDGTDLESPRVFKLYRDTTYVGRDPKSAIGKQYFYIDGTGIDRDHCTIQNQNDIVTLIPRGEIWLNGKRVTTTFVLRHGAVIRFGRNTKFCFYDPQVIQKSKLISRPIKQENADRSAPYGSLPILTMNGGDKANDFPPGASNIRPKKTSTINVVEKGSKIDVLPGLLEVFSETETRFLHAVFDNYPLENIHFRLSPIYTLYMTLRHRLSPYGKINVTFLQKQENVISLLHHIEHMINKKLEECQQHSGYLAYWLSNTSELLYFLKHDRDLSKISHDIQVRLTESIRRLFDYLINCLQNELDKYLMAFINSRNDGEHDIHTTTSIRSSTVLEEHDSTILQQFDPRWIIFDRNKNQHRQTTLDDLLTTLSSMMNLLRKCRVNVGLTIQIFSKIFHYISTWLFNRIVCYPELKLCSCMSGEKLLVDLKAISDWAQSQGLELACECHLMKMNQLCLLLKSPKSNPHDVQELLSNQTFNINSIQITQILNNYILSRNEPSISNSFYQALLSAAYKHVDENLYCAGSPIELAEELDLAVPFFLPEDGYSCENLRGIPEKLFEFIEPMSRLALCRLFTNSFSLGLWIEFIQLSKIGNSKNNDKIETIILNKKGNSLGLSIVSAKSDSQEHQGIYIKGIIPGSAAQDDGRLHVGDQILYVDSISLLDKTKEEAAKVLKHCGPSVRLQLYKDAANRYGLSALLTSSLDNHYGSTDLHSKPNSSLISCQYPHSTLALQTTNSYEQLSTTKQNLTTRNQHNLLSSSLVQPYLSNDLFSNGKANHQQRSKSSSYLIENDQETPYVFQQHQSNPNIFNSKQINEQQVDNIEKDLQKKTFTRSTSRTKSLITRHLFRDKPVVFREDIPPNQNESHQINSAIPPKTLPKPVINIFALMKRPKSTNDLDISKESLNTSLSSSTNNLTPSIRNFSVEITEKNLKPEIEQQALTESTYASESNTSAIRSKRIYDLINKFNRTEQEQKELSNLQVDDKFDRRVEEFYSQAKNNNNQKISSQSTNGTDEINRFDEKLKRRLEQFEQEREAERAYISRMLVKTENDIETRLRKDREREIRADRDINEFKTRRLCEEERILDAKKEQTRLLKHMRFPNSRIGDDQLPDISDGEHTRSQLDSDNNNSTLQQNSLFIDEQEMHVNPRLNTKIFSAKK
ncbi:unnamed protein product [Rotaria socialis]